MMALHVEAHGARPVLERAWAVVERTGGARRIEELLTSGHVVGLFDWRGRSEALALAERLGGAPPTPSRYRLPPVRVRSRGSYDCGPLSVVPCRIPRGLLEEIAGRA